MIKAHTDSTAKMKAAAATANPALTPNAEMTADQQEDLAELGKMKGVEFDKEYIDDQVNAHEDAVVLLRDYSAKGDTPALRTVAGELLPVVQGHLDHARRLDK
jgi:putative membrane protein